MADIEVFGGPGCMQCEAAKRLLTEHGLAFVERSIDDERHMTELRRRLPRSLALPQIFVAGEHVGSTEDLVLAHQRGRPPFVT